MDPYDYDSFNCDGDSDNDDGYTWWDYGAYDNDNGRSDEIPPLQSWIGSTQQYSATRLIEAVEDVDDLLLLQSRNGLYEHACLDWNTHVA